MWKGVRCLFLSLEVVCRWWGRGGGGEGRSMTARKRDLALMRDMMIVLGNCYFEGGRPRSIWNILERCLLGSIGMTVCSAA